MAPTNTAAERIDKARLKADRSQRWLSNQTGISLSSLGRKLNGHADFYLDEVAKIARALNVPTSSLLPPDFTAEAEPAERRILAGIAA